jgi:putative glutamine amidotransferase
MPSPPLIGVTASITVDKQPERAYVNSAYLRAVQRAGGVPVLLPPQLGAGARDVLWNGLAGLLLTGGGDIDPARFGEPRHPSVYEVSAERDSLELDLATRAVDDGLPLFAICRGIQVLNVALGGSLYQDIPSDPGSLIAHSQTEPRHVATHPVKIEPGTRLATITGAHTLDVNSMHHQAIKAVGRGLVTTATAPDGIVEAVESTDGRFVVGVQWHPEDLVGHDPAAEALFAALIAAARRHHR